MNLAADTNSLRLDYALSLLHARTDTDMLTNLGINAVDSDEWLAARVQQGDVQSFGILVERFQPKLQRYGRRFLSRTEDIEDLVQDIFLKAYQGIQSYSSKRRFSPWIYRIAHNTFVDALKRRRIETVPFFDPDVLWPHPVAPDNPAVDADQKLLRQELDTCLDQLDSKYREALVLRYYEELSYQEIADVLRLPTGTVSIRIKRGLMQLQARYHEQFPHA